MRVLIFLFSIQLLLMGCKNDKVTPVDSSQYASYGEKISEKNAIGKEEMMQKYAAMNEGDTIYTKFATSINEVCKKKGCWMKLNLGNEQESMVRFKDYSFFVPKDIDNKDVIVSGKAYVTTISVDMLKHYAKDGGASQEEIDKITEPEQTYAFEADGVLLKR